MGAIDLEGRPVPIHPGDTVASAMYRAGVRTFTRSLKHHRRRGPYCLSGDCASCLLTVDGQPGIRSCTTEARDGMRVERSEGFPSVETDLLAALDNFRWLMPVGFYSKTFIRPGRAWPLAERAIRAFTGLGRLSLEARPWPKDTRTIHPDLLVVGAGVAGLAAATEAARSGASVVLCDEGRPGEAVAPGPTLQRIRALEAEIRSLDSVTVLERHTAIGLYDGPLVPLVGEEVVLARPRRVVIATGALERHVAFPGNDLPGVWLGRGAARMVGVHGIPIGRRAVVVTGSAEAIDHIRTLDAAGIQVLAVVPTRLAPELPDGVRAALDGTIVAAEGRTQLEAVVIATGHVERRVRCDALVLSASRDPRDALLRMAAPGEALAGGDVIRPGCSTEEAVATGVEAARGTPLPPVEPTTIRSGTGGYVCLCEDVTLLDLGAAWEEGWRSPEILKRYTTATMGPCRGAICGRLLASFVADGAASPEAAGRTTARPPVRPVALEDLAAGVHETVERRTALHERHLELGARLDWSGSWKRPLHYGDAEREYRAVRERAGIMDVGTLGRFLVAGRDATALLDRLLASRVDDLRPGRSRYVLALDEGGYVLDDGVLCALGGGRFLLTSTSGGADRMEARLRDWADRLDLHVHLVNQTAMLGAINVAGPRARELLVSLGAEGVGVEDLPHLAHAEVEVAGVPCRAIRVGFVGEVSFELHHPRGRGVELWDALLRTGAELDVRPHGLATLDVLRLEKGHPYLGQDALPDDHPGKLGLGWAVSMDKPAFVGKTALERMAALPLERTLVGLELAPATHRGTPLVADGAVVGRVTSCAWSWSLGRTIGLGWLRITGGAPPAELTAGGRPAAVVPRPFYDPEGARLRA